MPLINRKCHSCLTQLEMSSLWKLRRLLQPVETLNKLKLAPKLEILKHRRGCKREKLTKNGQTTRKHIHSRNATENLWIIGVGLKRITNRTRPPNSNPMTKWHPSASWFQTRHWKAEIGTVTWGRWLNNKFHWKSTKVTLRSPWSTNSLIAS